MQIYCVVFALSREINKQIVFETFNFLSAGNKDFVKYQAQRGGGLTPNPTPCVRPCLSAQSYRKWLHIIYGSDSFGDYCNVPSPFYNCSVVPKLLRREVLRCDWQPVMSKHKAPFTKRFTVNIILCANHENSFNHCFWKLRCWAPTVTYGNEKL